MQYGSIAGLVRFALDAFLVVLYGVLLLQFQNYERFLLTLLIVDYLYSVCEGR